MNHILIIEDDKALSQGIVLALQNAETILFPCFSISCAKTALADKHFDLVILDINLPDGNGLDYLCTLKKYTTMPIILLTANDLETDIVTGFELGADDYITKPFSLAVLRARVNARLRTQISHTGRYEQSPFLFDFDKMEFYKENESIEFSKTEQKLLRLFVQNKGITLERGVLVDSIWTDGASYVDENALSVTVKRLRDKLEDTPTKPKYIVTVYGIGYRWVVT